LRWLSLFAALGPPRSRARTDRFRRKFLNEGIGRCPRPRRIMYTSPARPDLTIQPLLEQPLGMISRRGSVDDSRENPDCGSQGLMKSRKVWADSLARRPPARRKGSLTETVRHIASIRWCTLAMSRSDLNSARIAAAAPPVETAMALAFPISTRRRPFH
jgi:hypothetical protein